ncbi:MAG: hypothetical protein AB1546_03925 [bacterium]
MEPQMNTDEHRLFLRFYTNFFAPLRLCEKYLVFLHHEKLKPRINTRSSLPALLLLFSLFLSSICLPENTDTKNLQHYWTETLAFYDFTTGRHGWRGNGYLRKPTITKDGLYLTSIGVNPWMESQPTDFPPNKEVMITIRMKTDGDNRAKLWYGREIMEKQVMRFNTLPDGNWHEYSLQLPPLGPTARLRLAPFSGEGHITIAWIRITNASPIYPESFIKPVKPQKGASAPFTISSGALHFIHFAQSFDGFILNVGDSEFAPSYENGLIGYVNEKGIVSWLEINKAKLDIQKTDKMLSITGTLKDNDGVTWTLSRTIRQGALPDTLEIKHSIAVSRERKVIHIPYLTLLPGLGTFGEKKHQSLFAGLEYLEDEPSSSEADIRGVAHDRRVPDPVKITFPLMALAHSGKFLAVIWEPSERTAAIFDSPDRLFHSNAHLMALWAPAVGNLRRENAPYAFGAFILNADKPVETQATLIGGTGDTVVPAIQKYITLKGLPSVPEFSGGFDGAVSLLAGGWLDSNLHGDGLWRHALGGNNFPLVRAADAPALMLYLANHAADAALAERLRSGARHGLERLRETNPDSGQAYDPNFTSGVSHVRFHTPPLLFGNVSEYVDQVLNHARHIASANFNAGGIRHYRPSHDRPDYSTTHSADHANGLAAADLFYILQAAALSGDDELLKTALRLLDLQTELYANTVPRGAQTWEIPLHTPDILASAYLVKIYTLGYALTGRENYLEQARYWAWTGLPFVYLTPPAPGAVSNYSTIAVLGATNWEAPVWIGLPVQWCGLVYASALHQLSEYDPEGPWSHIAQGITAAGLLMSYPLSDTTRQGLLPDSYDLKSQWRNGPDINPGTVQAHLSELFGKEPLYNFKRLSVSGWLMHAPCNIINVKESKQEVQFTASGFGAETYSILIARVPNKPKQVLAKPAAHQDNANNIADTPKNLPFTYDPNRKLLLLKEITGAVDITILTK